MKIRIRFNADVPGEGTPARLVVRGDLDLAAAGELETTFRWVVTMHGHSRVAIDISELEFCDSAGWSALSRCRAAGATLTGDPPCLRRLFYLIRHAHLLPPELHELRGYSPAAENDLPEHTAQAA